MNIENVKLMQMPSDILRQVCVEVDYSEDLKLFADKMYNIMIENNGIGLAANQANIPWRMFVMKTGKMKKPKTFINPVILYSCVPYKDEEGCLSCPNVKKEIIRNRYILIEYINYDGKKVSEHLRDLEARCAQHEIDHLNGILIADSV
jgi:peptide deformylase